jgi:hypothetical protein
MSIIVMVSMQHRHSALLQEILPFCQRYGVLDGTAYLLERLGDIPAALDIYITQVTLEYTVLI